MEIAKNVLETIGNTPLIKLNKIVEGVKALVLAKLSIPATQSRTEWLSR